MACPITEGGHNNMTKIGLSQSSLSLTRSRAMQKVDNYFSDILFKDMAYFRMIRLCAEYLGLCSLRSSIFLRIEQTSPR